MEGFSTMWSSKWKWGAGAVIAIAAAGICYRWCGHHELIIGKDDEHVEHARMCAKRHPPFPPRPKVPRGSGDTTPRRGSGDTVPPKLDTQPPAPPKSDVQPAAAKAAAGTAPAAPQSLLGDPGTTGDGDPLAGVSGDCPPSVCGMNGTWLGSGVPFRTLHLSPYRHNEANLSILKFLGPERHGHRASLTLHVDGDRLHPTDRDIVEVGSVLQLGPAETPGGAPRSPTYEITITGVQSHPFLVDCQGCSRTSYPVYEFSARSLDDDCPLEVCDPSLDDGSDTTHNLIGNAVIFHGDFYEPGYTVKPAAATGYDDDTFNIACVGTAISKLHLLRHTSASQGAPADPLPPPVDKRQAMLRMLTADYCGAGHPFTHDGVPLNFGIDLAAGYDGLLNPGPNPPSPDPNTGITVPARSQFRLDGAGGMPSIDALWTGDGATCIGTPRQLVEDPQNPQNPQLWKQIEAVCRSVNHPVKHCADVAPTQGTQPDTHLQLDSYAISQIPPS